MAESPRGYAVRVDISAELARVWRALTVSAHMKRWCSENSQIAAREGGSFRASLDRHKEMQAHIDIFEPMRRLRLIHMPEPGIESSESAIVDELFIEERDGETIVRALGSGFLRSPHYDALMRQYQAGWRLALARLKVYLEKRLDEAPPK